MDFLNIGLYKITIFMWLDTLTINGISKYDKYYNIIIKLPFLLFINDKDVLWICI